MNTPLNTANPVYSDTISPLVSVETCGEEMRRYTDIMFRVYTGQLVTIKTTRRPSRSDRAPPREQPRMLVKAQHEAATEIYL